MMQRILVVGATGQLGRATVRKLQGRGVSVRALTRTPDAAAQFQDAEVVSGDLTDRSSLNRACAGVATIVATATAAVPTRTGDTFAAVDGQGYRNLIEAARTNGVARFVYTSAPVSRYTSYSQLLQCKRQTEEALVSSGMDVVILRTGVFMDTAFSMMGSALPIQNAEGATILRPFPFASRHYARIRDSIERKGVALIPGNGVARHGFICVEDVAAFLATAAVSGPSGVHSVGGPEALTYLDVVRLFERILGVTLRVQRTPATVFRLAARILRPFSPAAANLMGLNYIAASEDSPADDGSAAAFGVALTTAEAFLRAKNGMATAA